MLRFHQEHPASAEERAQQRRRALATEGRGMPRSALHIPGDDGDNLAKAGLRSGTGFRSRGGQSHFRFLNDRYSTMPMATMRPSAKG